MDRPHLATALELQLIALSRRGSRRGVSRPRALAARFARTKTPA